VPFTHVAGTRPTHHPIAEGGRVGEDRGDEIARRDVVPAHAHWCRRPQAGAVEHAQKLGELFVQAVLERHPIAYNLARDQQHLFVLDVHALHRSDALRKYERFRLAERRSGEPAPLAFPHERGIQALLDRRPDRERRRELVARDLEVAAVAHADLVDLGKEMVGGVAREDIREPRLDTDADEREQAAFLPGRRRRELLLAEHSPDQFVGPLGCGLESVIAMSRYVQPQANAAAKIDGLNRGSHALTTASMRSCSMSASSAC